MKPPLPPLSGEDRRALFRNARRLAAELLMEHRREPIASDLPEDFRADLAETVQRMRHRLAELDDTRSKSQRR